MPQSARHVAGGVREGTLVVKSVAYLMHTRIPVGLRRRRARFMFGEDVLEIYSRLAVSYTHLTLPTIYSV